MLVHQSCWFDELIIFFIEITSLWKYQLKLNSSFCREFLNKSKFEKKNQNITQSITLHFSSLFNGSNSISSYTRFLFFSSLFFCSKSLCWKSSLRSFTDMYDTRLFNDYRGCKLTCLRCYDPNFMKYRSYFAVRPKLDFERRDLTSVSVYITRFDC